MSRLQISDEFLLPNYGDGSIANIPATIAALLGPPPFAPEAAGRVGDVIVALRGGHALLNTRAEDAARAMRWNGRHGGMTEAEMLVPWLGFRLDDI